ncbi:diguanylate cyclase (GGDEF) domain-containing protein [Marinobacter persicus]|uniref:Diguanylate cyclase (GGDEF) domain-containing protein n=1 Tax=Marinobacter persicus TaxID=930118 RepID=A0A1I3V6A3_9GAMM|nr:diguanylate cyclase (GGDEF) domain-containing protein [Marinobacter persicus]
MNRRAEPSLNVVPQIMILLGIVMVAFIWTLFLVQSAASRDDALQAQRSENSNLALIISESLKQMTDRARAMASLAGDELAGTSSRSARLLTLLAEDPVFNRLSIYEPNGNLRYSSHPDSARTSIGPWLSDLADHTAKHGYTPVLPSRRLDPAMAPGQTAWRLPFLVPEGKPGNGRVDRWILVELDIGYLSGLLQHVNLGYGGFLQILDGEKNEWMRADTLGVMVGGKPVKGLFFASSNRVNSGAGSFELSGKRHQYVYANRSPNNFTVVVAQPEEQILAAALGKQNQQLVLNVLMTLLVAGIVVWLVRTLRQQQLALKALQKSERRNQNLIERLEGEHARTTRAASIDHLSGLYNRRQFLDVAAQALASQRRQRRLSALLFIDLDRFKSINDSLGHHIGDLLLQAVAGRIQHRLGDEDLAGRFGGDEFVVFMGGNRTEVDIEKWVSGLVEHLSAPYQLDGSELNSSPSVGIAISPRDGQSIDDLLRGADAAMYSAKRAGRGQYRFFDQSLNSNSDIEEFHLEQAFADALRERQFVLHYQPQVCLDSMEIVGYETLVRWQHPDYGLLFPDRFIPMAERSGFVVPLGMEVIRLACEQLVEWQQQGLKAHPLAVNVSPIQLSEPGFCDRVRAEMERHGLAQDMLELEVTETAVLDEQAMENLNCLNDAGIRLSLDDFGTGYSGLAHLESVPVGKLKIDRSLISRICNSHDDSPVVSSTIILAKRMNLKVVAEGVETPEQLVHLKVAGCDIAQGYHLSRPIPAADVPHFHATFNRLQETG